jgi:type IV secretion system protein VirD4
VSGFLLLAILINWETTQQAARLLGYSRLLGPTLLGGIYAPWEWLVWWSRWHGAERLEPLWELCTREVALPLLGIGGLAAGAILITRYLLSGTNSDLHGSARWATTRDVRAAGLIAPRRYVPGPIRRLVVRVRLMRPLPRRVGIYLGIWRHAGGRSYLRDCGPGHVLAVAPTRSGKGVGPCSSDLAHLAALGFGSRPQG